MRRWGDLISWQERCLRAEIKTGAEAKHIPVIALTAHAMAGGREKALSAGSDDVDNKPIELPRLPGKIKALAERVGS